MHGDTVSWTAIPGVASYKLATVLNPTTTRHTTYVQVTGTSFTPPAVPGQTVNYGLAASAPVAGPWAHEVTIAYPRSGEPPKAEEPAKTEEKPKAEEPPKGSEPPKTEEPKTEESPGPPVEEPGKGSEAPLTGFQPGLDSGTNPTYDIPGAAQLGAKVVRIEFSIGTSVAAMQNTISVYAAKGIRVAPLAGFYGTLPTPAEAQNLSNWAKAYGPGGTYWANRTDGRLAIQTIEFGNETSGGYQYHDNAGDASYNTRANTYAIRLKEAAQAITATNIKVGLLAVSEDWTGDWVNGMFNAVPNLGNYVAGWISHPYGTGWKTKFENIIKQTAAHGAPPTIPIDVTEWGIATDNGNCLTDNFGWNKCMTYNEAATTLNNTITEMRQTLGSRLGLFLLYQVRDQQQPGTTTNREAYFGALQHELAPKGAYTTQIKTLLASN
jgi:hypothetical protein